MIAIITLLLIVSLSLLVTRVATVALVLTGMSQQSARFQARSALTGVGFTTSEAESILNHPVRRRIVMMLMLIGSAGIVTSIASLSVSFTGVENVFEVTRNLLILLAGVVGLLLLAKNQRVEVWLQRIIQRLLRRYTDLDVRDYAALLHVHGAYSVSELEVRADGWLAGRTLADLALSDEGVLVLGIQRGPDLYVGAPRGDNHVEVGDVLILYGPAERIEDLGRRPAGPEGERARREAVEAERRQEAEVQRVQEERTEEIGTSEGA